MLNNISLISKKFRNKTPFLPPLNFKLFARGDMYTTDLQRVYFMFSMVCHDLLVAMFFIYLIFYRLLGVFRRKNILPLTNDIYAPKNLNGKRTF